MVAGYKYLEPGQAVGYRKMSGVRAFGSQHR